MIWGTSLQNRESFLMIQNIGNASFSIVTGHWSTKWICLTRLWDCENVFNIWLKIEIWYFGMLLAVVAFKGFWGIFITMRAQGRHIHYTYILANWRNYFKTFGKTLNFFLLLQRLKIFNLVFIERFGINLMQSLIGLTRPYFSK